MRIEMIKTRRQTNVPEKVGRVLIDKGMAVEVGSAPVVSRQTYLTRDMRAAPLEIPTFTAPVAPIETKTEPETVGEVTGDPHSEDDPTLPDPLDDAPTNGAPVAQAKEDRMGLDAEGAAWNPDLHTADRMKTRAGAWRKKPGAKAAA